MAMDRLEALTTDGLDFIRSQRKLMNPSNTSTATVVSAIPVKWDRERAGVAAMTDA
jgi:hypothetical protein